MGSYKKDNWKRVSRSSRYKYSDRIDFDNDDKFYHKEPFHSKMNGCSWDWSDRKHSKHTKSSEIWSIAERIRSRYYKTHSIDEMFSIFASRINYDKCCALTANTPREVFYWRIDKAKQASWRCTWMSCIDNRFYLSDCGNYLIDKPIRKRKKQLKELRDKKYRSSIKYIINKNRKNKKRDLSKYLIRKITNKKESQDFVLKMNQHKYQVYYDRYTKNEENLSFLLQIGYNTTLYGR